MTSDPNSEHPEIEPVEGGDMHSQLVALYEEKRRLFRELGTADPDVIIAMVRSLEAQLVDLYSSSDES